MDKKNVGPNESKHSEFLEEKVVDKSQMFCIIVIIILTDEEVLLLYFFHACRLLRALPKQCLASSTL